MLMWLRQYLPQTCIVYTQHSTYTMIVSIWTRLPSQDYVAIKIVRNIDKYRHAAIIEVCAGRTEPAALLFLTAFLYPDSMPADGLLFV